MTSRLYLNCMCSCIHELNFHNKCNVWALWSKPGWVSAVIECFQVKANWPQWIYLMAWYLHIYIVIVQCCVSVCCWDLISTGSLWSSQLLWSLVWIQSWSNLMLSSHLTLIPLSLHSQLHKCMPFCTSASVIHGFPHDVIVSAGTKFLWSGHYLWTNITTGT